MQEAAGFLYLFLVHEFLTEVGTTWQDDAPGKLVACLAEIATNIIGAGEASFRLSLIEAVDGKNKGACECPGRLKPNSQRIEPLFEQRREPVRSF